MSAPVIRRGTCVAFDGRAALVCGGTGAGKSQLALSMLGMGAQLIADDQVILQNCDDRLMASAPAPIKGQIEARGVGILNVATADKAEVVLVVDLERAEAVRLPQAQQISITDVCLPLIAGKSRPNLASELMACLRSGAAPLMLDPDGPADGEQD